MTMRCYRNGKNGREPPEKRPGQQKKPHEWSGNSMEKLKTKSFDPAQPLPG